MNLQVAVTFRHVDPSDALRDYATDKVSRIAGKYLKRAQEAHVILSVNKHRHSAEINIHASHFDISAHESTADLYSAIDMCLSKLETQLRKHNDRLNHHKGAAPPSGNNVALPVDVFAAEQLDESGTPTVIETDSMPTKPLSVEDAIFQLELTHYEFLVFRNSVTDAINVVYKRRDGNYGLIVPNS